MKSEPPQCELFGLLWEPLRHPFRLRINDLIRWDGKIGLVIRVSGRRVDQPEGTAIQHAL